MTILIPILFAVFWFAQPPIKPPADIKNVSESDFVVGKPKSVILAKFGAPDEFFDAESQKYFSASTEPNTKGLVWSIYHRKTPSNVYEISIEYSDKNQSLARISDVRWRTKAAAPTLALLGDISEANELCAKGCRVLGSPGKHPTLVLFPTTVTTNQKQVVQLLSNSSAASLKDNMLCMIVWLSSNQKRRNAEEIQWLDEAANQAGMAIGSPSFYRNYEGAVELGTWNPKTGISSRKTPNRMTNSSSHVSLTVEQHQQALPISPSFARTAFMLKQSIDRLRWESVDPIVDGDAESSPYAIHEKALNEQLERIKMFDLQTQGDRELFSMLETAMTFSSSDSLLRQQRLTMSGRTFQCLESITKVIEARQYKGEGNCVWNNEVRDGLAVDRGRAVQEHQRVIDEYKAKSAEIKKNIQRMRCEDAQGSLQASDCLQSSH